MINRNISVHLQDFPNLNFINNEEKLVADMDLVRHVCSAALSIRDHKNVRVRLPLNKLTVIGKNASQILDFKDIIAEEVNVKNIEIEENLEEKAELKLQINFKKIGVKYGSKVKEIMAESKLGNWQKISENEIEIAGLNLIDDEFELKLMPKNLDDKKFAIIALPDNSCLISLDIEVTEELAAEGIARDIVRAVQQARKDADLDVSNRINLQIFSSNPKITQIARNWADYIKEQVLALDLSAEYDEEKMQSSVKFFTKTKIEDGDLSIGIDVT